MSYRRPRQDTRTMDARTMVIHFRVGQTRYILMDMDARISTEMNLDSVGNITRGFVDI